MKKRNTILRKIMCFAMAGAICAQIIPANMFAAPASWNLYFNPTRPPAESKLSWSKRAWATTNPAECVLTSGNYGTAVQFSVDPASGTPASVEHGKAGYVGGIQTGHEYTYRVKYTNTTSGINYTSGTITY